MLAQIPDSGSGFFSIPDPGSWSGFFPSRIPHPGVKKSTRSRIRNTAKNYFEINSRVEIGRGGYGSAWFIDWSVNCGYSGCSGFLLERQVLPNQADCVNRSCSQPHQLINKAVIILIGNTRKKSQPVFRIRITLMRIRVLLFTSVRVRMLLFTLLWSG